MQQTPFALHKHLRVLFVGLLQLACFASHAQINADFSASKTEGCAPLSVIFTNTSTGASASAKYTLDPGTGDIKNFSGGAFFTYTSAGTYTITLTVTDGGIQKQQSKTIRVYENPKPDFTLSADKGCPPFPVTFSSTSTAGDGSIASYFWDFGDGNTQDAGSQGQIVHAYTFGQKPTVSLTVTNNHGCYATIQKPAVLQIYPAAKADFQVEKKAICNETDEVSFTNTSKGANLSYLWDFGDGNTSTSQNPKWKYNKKGIFSIKLAVTSGDGCADSTRQDSLIHVANFNVDFDLPAVVCKESPVSLANTSVPVSPVSLWTSDEGISVSSSDGAPGLLSFKATGKHKVTLTNTYGSCLTTYSKTIDVRDRPVLKGFVASVDNQCGAPVAVHFRDTTASVTSWQWNFNASNSGAVDEVTQNPSHTFTADGDYSIALKVSDGGGCSDSITQVVHIQKPQVTIDFSKSTSQAGKVSCEPFSLTLQAKSADSITSYQWDLGNGNRSNDPHPVASFSEPDSYTIKLDYTTAQGCRGQATYDQVTVFEQPKVDFTTVSTEVCGNTPVVFSAQATKGTVTEWKWDFGDEIPVNAPTSNPSHAYFKEGVFSVRLIGSNGSCGDTVVKKDLIRIQPPFAKISAVTNTCDDDRGTVTFNYVDGKAAHYNWDFGDGATADASVGNLPVHHSYTKTGAFKVMLTTTSGQCVVKDSVTAYVLLRQKPTLAADKKLLCTSDSLQVEISGTEANPYPSSSAYSVARFIYGDGSEFTGSSYNNGTPWTTTYTGGLTGLSNRGELKAIVQSAYFGCFDTTSAVTLDVRGPVPSFEVAKNSLCYKTPYVFTDKSTGTHGVGIKRWEWSFGDSTGQNGATGGTVTHQYPGPGNYQVRLKVTDEEGCSAFIDSRPLSALGPKAAAAASDTSILPATTVYFSNNSTPYNGPSAQYIWRFSDGSTSADASFSRTYNHIGSDTVRLVATDPASICSDTAVLIVNVKKVLADFQFATSYVNRNDCPPLLARFTSTSVNVDSLSWDFGDGSRAGNQPSPSHTFNKPGNYQVTLYAYTATGYKDSTIRVVKVAGPHARLMADTLGGCLQQTVTLRAQLQDANSFIWDMGDGTLKPSKDTLAVYHYTVPGVYTPAIILNDTSGCSASFELAEKIVIDSLNASIQNMPDHFCDSAMVNFTAKVFSIAADQAGKSLWYHWNFGTGNPTDTAGARDTTFLYTKPGTYASSLLIKSPYGCQKELALPVVINEKPKASIVAPAEVCQGAAVQFSAVLSSSEPSRWEWQFGNGDTVSGQNVSSYVFNDTSLQDVRLIVSRNACTDTATAKIRVHAKPDLKVAVDKDSLCQGQSVLLKANGQGQFAWTPAVGLSAAGSAQPTAKPDSSITYQVRLADGRGCIAADSVHLTVFRPFKMEVISNAVVCEGKGVQLWARGADTYEWTTNSGAISSLGVANPMVYPAANSSFEVTGYDAYHCFSDKQQVAVTVHPAPTVNAGPDMEVLAVSEYQFHPVSSNDVSEWRWLPADYLSCTNCADPTTKPRNSVSYVVNVKNAYGCEASDTINIKVVCSDGYVYIPNVFSPNRDGKNDVFYIKGRGVSTIKSLSIFNRWGEAVFQKTNFFIDDRSSGWDGTYKGYPVPAGSYIYIAEMQCNAGEVFTQKGTVTVIY